jgi:hypothetical protein
MANTLEKAIRSVLTEAGPDSIPGRVEPTPEFHEVGGSTHDNVAPKLDYAKTIKPGQGKLPNASGGGPEKNPTKYKKSEDLDPKKEMSEEEEVDGDSLEEDSERLPNWLKTLVSENLEEEEEISEEDEISEEEEISEEDEISEEEEEVEFEINEEYFNEKRAEAFSVAEESLLSIFGDNKLSESFKTKLVSVFEAAVQTQVEVIREELEARYELALNEQVKEISNALVERVDTYLDYVAEQWLNENEIAIERSMKAELTESFMSDLKKLFEEHYIEVPEKKLDVLNSLAEQNEKLSVQLNKTLTELIETKMSLKEYKKEELITEATRGMIDSKASKLRKLAEAIEFDDDFEEKINSLKETVNGSSSKTSKKTTLTEDADKGKDMNEKEKKSTSDPLIEQTLNILNRTGSTIKK